MINTYVDEGNPCVFCVEKPDDVRVEKKKEYLEIALCGNDTTLYVRETSVEDLKTQKTDSLKNEFEAESSIDTMTTDQIPIDSIFSHKTIKSTQNEMTDYKTAGNEIQNLYTKKWSGKTYFEEELRKIRKNEYKKEMNDSLKRRRIWKQFQKQMAAERKRDLMKSSGPEWWQEPSLKQICLATTLADIIKADHEEGVTGRTRQWLLDLGVTTRLTPRQVKGCMKRCLLDPIDFLLESHAMIVKSQLSVKKRGDLERPFSINERILLSAVCVLQLPTLLTILHYILPPPKPFSDEKHMLELLFGDVTDESIRYATPYMEPLPFRDNKHFQEWAFDKVFRALLPSIWPHEREDFASKTTSRRSVTATISSLKTSIIAESKRFSETKELSKHSSRTVTPPVFWLVSHCVSKRKPTSSIVGVPSIEEEYNYPRTFSRRLTSRSYLQTYQQKESVTKDVNSKQIEKEEYFPQDNLYEAEATDTHGSPVTKVFSLSYLGSHTLLEKESLNRVYSSTENQAVSPLEENPDTDTFTDEFQEPNTLFEYQQNELNQDVKSVEKSQKLKKKENISALSVQSLGLYEEDNNDESEKFPKCIELQKLWNEIRALPEKNQLCRAIKVLAEMGEPIAQLPKVDKLPTIQRWLELRRGENRALSHGKKEELLRSSRGMWKLAPLGCSTQGPKVKCSKRDERLLTWDRKNWLQSEAKNEIKKYYTRMRQEKVDNSRAFFPTMLNHYDYGSKLNRNFRETFFTYMPAREADTFVYRPWQPQETRNSKAT